MGAYRPDLDELVARVESLAARTPGRVLIGVAGKPGSGKTTLAQALVRRLAGVDDWRGSRAAHVPLDGFHLADQELVRLGRTARKGAPDTFDAAGYVALLERIRAGHSVYAPSFERDLEQPIAGALPVTPATRIVVSEGNYLLLDTDPWPAARACFDEVWAMEQDEQVRLERLVARHIEFGKTPEAARAWVERSDQANAALVEPGLATADLTIGE